MAQHNPSAEVRLEQAIAGSGPGWANQIPICSGLVGPSADRRRAIDLVHRVGEGHFEFIELKVASDTPLYAAIEIIGYACVWLLARRDDAVPTSELLSADRVDLIVLAPASYYARYRLDRLAAALDGELAELGTSAGVRLSFRFEILPDALVGEARPAGRELLALLDQRRRL